MRAINWTIISVVTALALATCACAQKEFVDYPEFRYTSALPGGGWGVTPDGVPGFEGAIQTNIPVAYTPHQGIILGYGSASYDTTPQIGFSGGDVNGTATIAMGFGSSGHGLYICEMGTSNKWEPAKNLQYQVVPASADRPAVAVGVVDILSQRNQSVFRTRRGHTVSYYAVATQQFGSEAKPVYVSLGAGFRRFNGVFGGVSWRAHEKITLNAEYDGWNVNAGAAFDLSEWLTDDVILFANLVDLDRTVIGMTYVYNK